MSPARRPSVLALLAVPLLLGACAATPPSASTAPAPTAGHQTAPTSTEPAPSASGSEPPLAGDVPWHRFSTENGMVSISVPSTWTVEGGATASDFGDAQWIWVRNSLRHEMALLTIGTGGDRGGGCGDEVDGVFQPDDDGMLPARIHAVEVLDLGDELDAFGTPGEPHLVAATVQSGEAFGFHVGFLPEPPQNGLVPCHWYDDVAVPAGFPDVTLGTPSVDTAGGLWLVDSFEAGEAYTATEEFATLMAVMRSLQLHP